MNDKEKQMLNDLANILPYKNTAKTMRAVFHTKNIEGAETIPAIVEQNPVALGWAYQILGVQRVMAKINMINSGAGARTVTYNGLPDNSFVVLGCMIDISGNDLTPSSPIQVVFTGVSNTITVFETRFSGTVQNIKDPSAKGGHRAIIVLFPACPQVTYDLTGSLPPAANSRFVIPSVELTNDDLESADSLKAETITVQVSGISSDFITNIQLLTPGNPNYDEIVTRLMEDDIISANLDQVEGASSVLNF